MYRSAAIGQGSLKIVLFLEQFRRDYPDSEFSDDVTQKLAVTYMESGKAGQAAAEFERIASAETSAPDVRREALWKASELYKQTGTISSEQRVLNDIVARYPNPLAESIEARYRHYLRRRSDKDSFANTKMGDNAIVFGIYANALTHRPLSLQTLDLAPGHAERCEPIS